MRVSSKLDTKLCVNEVRQLVSCPPSVRTHCALTEGKRFSYCSTFRKSALRSLRFSFGCFGSAVLWVLIPRHNASLFLSAVCHGGPVFAVCHGGPVEKPVEKAGEKPG